MLVDGKNYNQIGGKWLDSDGRELPSYRNPLICKSQRVEKAPVFINTRISPKKFTGRSDYCHRCLKDYDLCQCDDWPYFIRVLVDARRSRSELSESGGHRTYQLVEIKDGNIIEYTEDNKISMSKTTMRVQEGPWAEKVDTTKNSERPPVPMSVTDARKEIILINSELEKNSFLNRIFHPEDFDDYINLPNDLK